MVVWGVSGGVKGGGEDGRVCGTDAKGKGEKVEQRKVEKLYKRKRQVD